MEARLAGLRLRPERHPRRHLVVICGTALQTPVRSWRPGLVLGSRTWLTLQAGGKEERQGCAALQSWPLPPALEWTGGVLVKHLPALHAAVLGGTGSCHLGKGGGLAICIGVSREETLPGRTRTGLSGRLAFAFGASLACYQQTEARRGMKIAHLYIVWAPQGSGGSRTWTSELGRKGGLSPL